MPPYSYVWIDRYSLIINNTTICQICSLGAIKWYHWILGLGGKKRESKETLS